MRVLRLFKTALIAATAIWLLPSNLDAQATQSCTNGEAECGNSVQPDLSESQAKLKSFNSLMVEARKLARNERDAQYLTGLDDGLRSQLKTCPRDDYYPHCLSNAIDTQVYALQSAVTEYRDDRARAAAAENEKPDSASIPTNSSGNPEPQTAGEEAQGSSQSNDLATQSASTESAPENTTAANSGPEREQTGGMFLAILFGLAGLMVYFGFKTGRISPLLDAFKYRSVGDNQPPTENLFDEAEIAKLTPEQQAIYQTTVQAAHSQARWGFVVWAICIFASLYFLIGWLIAREGIWESISLTGIAGGFIGVVAYWRLAYEGRKSNKVRAGSAAVQCKSCGSSFAIKATNRVERLIAAVPRTSTSSSSGQISQSGGGHRKYVDVRTSTWTEEKYEVTTDYQCVICSDETHKVTMKTRETNRHSGTERKYY